MLADNNAENVVQLNHEQKISEESEQERLKKLAAEIGTPSSPSPRFFPTSPLLLPYIPVGVQVVNGGHDVDWEHPTQYQIFFEKQKNDSWRLQV